MPDEILVIALYVSYNELEESVILNSNVRNRCTFVSNTQFVTVIEYVCTARVARLHMHVLFFI